MGSQVVETRELVRSVQIGPQDGWRQGANARPVGYSHGVGRHIVIFAAAIGSARKIVHRKRVGGYGFSARIDWHDWLAPR